MKIRMLMFGKALQPDPTPPPAATKISQHKRRAASPGPAGSKTSKLSPTRSLPVAVSTLAVASKVTPRGFRQLAGTGIKEPPPSRGRAASAPISRAEPQLTSKPAPASAARSLKLTNAPAPQLTSLPAPASAASAAPSGSAPVSPALAVTSAPSPPAPRPEAGHASASDSAPLLTPAPGALPAPTPTPDQQQLTSPAPFHLHSVPGSPVLRARDETSTYRKSLSKTHHRDRSLSPSASPGKRSRYHGYFSPLQIRYSGTIIVTRCI